MSHQKNLIATPSNPSSAGISRRSFLTRSSMAAAGALLLPSTQSVANIIGTERTLSFHNVHTDEELTIRCSPEKDYDRETRLRFSSLLRDHHADEVREMDPGLIDIFFAISAFTGTTGTFKVLSGYRSPETNSWLRRHSHGVAEHSMHIRMDELSTHELRLAGMALAMGGVGYYPRSNFVHLDTGRIRHW